MKKVAIVSFPGNNCEVESTRSISRAGMQPVSVRWNQDPATIEDVDAYFLVGGFNYEDRGRAGMVAARHPMMSFIKSEAAKGKVVIGNCNGAQVLVESGLVPLNSGLKMSLARNVVKSNTGVKGTGFINEWIYMKASCDKDRCATSNFEGVLHIPIAHGEGRFVTEDPSVIEELKANNQIAFQYCDSNGVVSEDVEVTPNGSLFSIAGICNPQGNVVAIMPHPERTPAGDMYFTSMRLWLENRQPEAYDEQESETEHKEVPMRDSHATEVYIDTIITNNEERTVEQALQTHLPDCSLTQMKFFALDTDNPSEILSHISIYNPNKEVAYIKRGQTVTKWNADLVTEEEVQMHPLTGSIGLIRTDTPDTGAFSLDGVHQTGICYVCNNVDASSFTSSTILEIFANPHASKLERIF